MGFIRFIKACSKYQFTFSLSTYGGTKLILRPNNTFNNIEIYGDKNYRKMFLKAIKRMKDYRKFK